jgi:hypothetical protein|tara:strand:+ start:1061 stop:1267 length:207 start_codon:yes stop_codon:yes gene_type:complete
MEYKPTFGQYLRERMNGCTIKGIHGEWLYVEEPYADELDFYYQHWLLERKRIVHTDEQLRRMKMGRRK